MERRIEGLMNRVLWKKVSWQKRRGMRSLSLSSPVASSPHKHTHIPHFISSNNFLFLCLFPHTHTQPTLLCPNSTSLMCRLLMRISSFFYVSLSVLHNPELLTFLLPDPFLPLSLLFLQVESNHHTHHSNFSAPHITITFARANSLPCPITAQFFLPPNPPTTAFITQ